MKASFSYFKRLAESVDIEVEYDQGYINSVTNMTIGYHITLTAPFGKWFKGSQCETDCSINGNIADGTVETKPQWNEAIAALKAIIAEGFDNAEDEA